MPYSVNVGDRFGRLAVAELVRIQGKRRTRAGALCHCDCGNPKTVQLDNLSNGRTTSCGCVRRAGLIERNTTHGLSKHPLYDTWRGIKERCYNANAERYASYGGRGITMCPEWRDDFAAFLSYVEKLDHYGEPGRTIDRIDNSLGYQPGNVRWATASEQNLNRRPFAEWSA
jgi:hypothetical protein